MQFLNSFQLLERINALLGSDYRKRSVTLGIKPVHVQVLEYLSMCNHYSDSAASLTEYLGLTKGTVSQSLNARSFGLCSTCVYIIEVDDHTHCGLIREPLKQEALEIICREHRLL